MPSRRKFLTSSLLGLGGLSTIFTKSGKAEISSSDSEELPVIDEGDICIIGGSCTGVFAAIRAARLGAKVIIMDKLNAFGGTATHSLVNVWHSLYNTESNKRIIAGLTQETLERLQKRDLVSQKHEYGGFHFNPEELKIELDEMIQEAGVTPHLHTFFAAPYLSNEGKPRGAIVENKSGRGVIKANILIDASGDGDLCYRYGTRNYTHQLINPPSTCAIFENYREIGHKVKELIAKHHEEFNLPEGFIWGSTIPLSETYMVAGTRVYDTNCAHAEELTKAEMEGRRQIRAIHDIIRKYAPEQTVALNNLPSQIGIRETRHIACQYQLKGDDVLYGKSFKDAIANGSYRVDIHHSDKPGVTFKYLDGRKVYNPPGKPEEKGRWREKTENPPTYYHIPLRTIIPDNNPGNLLLAGRMLDADTEAFSAVRVMVNLNQTGEAAGVTAYLALQNNQPVQDVPAEDVRSLLKQGGSVIL